jgi:gas vesicle protein
MARKKDERKQARTVRVTPEYPDERLGNFLRGFVLGALAGGVAALLNARQSGAQTREQIRAQVLQFRKQLDDLTSGARTATADVAAWAADENATWSEESDSADALTLALPTVPGEPPTSAPPMPEAEQRPPAEAPTTQMPRVP